MYERRVNVPFVGSYMLQKRGRDVLGQRSRSSGHAWLMIDRLPVPEYSRTLCSAEQSIVKGQYKRVDY